jgi:hypothetical protein
MLAPRRIGKTSLILRLCATAREHGRYAVHCSFAKCETDRPSASAASHCLTV